jgi:hypothetical protein
MKIMKGFDCINGCSEDESNIIMCGDTDKLKKCKKKKY